MADLFHPQEAVDAYTLTIQQYEETSSRTDRFQEDPAGMELVLLGLFGETGSLVSEVKKRQRGDRPTEAYKRAVSEELGDCLWYLFAVMRRLSISSEEVFTLSAANTTGLAAIGKFSDFQAPFHETSDTEPAAISNAAIALCAAAGSMCTSGPRWSRENPSASEEVHTFVLALATLASAAQVELQQAASANLIKIEDRWPTQKTFPAFFDAGDPAEERFPEKLVIDIFERTVGGKTFVYQRCNGINIGDPLTDNKDDPDDYRFHDVFHYAYAAVLGWSPVLRALFKLKRRSNPKKDENQDGARAILIEEGISSWVFEQARHQGFFEHIEPGNLSYDLLKTVNEFVAGYEADKCPIWVWEIAILEGFKCFRFLKQHRRGRITINLKRRSVEIRELD